MPTQKTTRRNFMKAGAALALGANVVMAGARRSDRPNLLFLWTDEQRRDTFAAGGNKRIHAPNLNQLASESVVFTQAYCTQPVCTPSRSSVMTGWWPHQDGCVKNNIPLRPETKALPEILNDPDYRTAYMGKWHLGDEIYAQHGFEEWVAIEDGYSKHYGESRDKNDRSAYFHYLKSLGLEPDPKSNTFGRGFCARLPIEQCKPEFLKRNAIDFLKRHKNEPFILCLNYLEPHMPFYGPLDDEHSPDEVTLPANFDDPLEDNEPLRYRLMRQHFYENGFDKIDLKTEAGWRRLIANYWGLVTQVDRSVGGIQTALEDLGLADNTLVVYTRDHGDMMGSHRLLTKTVSYEESVGIPWLIRAPQQGRSQKIIKHPVSQIDMVPTLLDLMGKPEEKAPFPGHSLVPAMQGGEFGEDHVYVEWNTFSQDLVPKSLPEEVKEDANRAQNAQWRMAVSPDGWKLCLCDRDKSQLYNLKDDPYETTNLFDSGKHQDVIDRLSKKIHGWQGEVGDTVEV